MQPEKRTRKRVPRTTRTAGEMTVPDNPNDLEETGAVHCTTCGYYAGNGVLHGPCPVCKQSLVPAPPS